MQSKKNKDIIRIQKKITPILKKNNVARAGIFGSYARGEAKKRSDIDILIEIKKDVSLLDIIGIELKLKKILNRKVDLIEYSSIYPLLKDRILNEEVRIL